MTLQEMETFAKTYEKSARVILKDDSWFMKVVAVLVWVFNRRFMSAYLTTIANRIYVPKRYIGLNVQRVLVHETEGHVRQARWCGLGIHPMVGIVPYAILYLLVPFFIFFAYFRFRFELNAELKACQYDLLNGNSAVYLRGRLAKFVTKITGADYLFSWVRPWALKRADKAFDKLLKGFGSAYNA
jgi:hypothetical protein